MAWLSGWSYRKEISITGQSGAGTDYQVKLNIGDSAGGDFHLEGHCTNFPQDIEVTDNDGTTLLKFWIEDITADPLKMTVKVADDLGSNQTIYIYYGKSGATTNSDGDTTFPVLFEDAEDLTTGQDPTGWTVSEGADTNIEVSEAQAKSGSKSILFEDNSATNNCNAYKTYTAQSGKFIIEFAVYTDTTTNYFGQAHRSSATNGPNFGFSSAGQIYYYDTGINNIMAYSASTWYRIKLQIDTDTDTYDIYVDDVSKVTGANFNNTVTSLDDILVWTSGDGSASLTGYIDNIFLRKYNSPEPAFSSAGSEETPPTGVTIPVFNHLYNQMRA